MMLIMSLLFLLLTPTLSHPPFTPFACYYGFGPCFDLRQVGYGIAVYKDSFIHSEDLYSASSRNPYSEALPGQPRTKILWRKLPIADTTQNNGLQMAAHIVKS